MFTIAKEIRFSAAHTIRGHTGGCERLHGHNYRVRVVLEAEELDELGMVMDFADLKGMLEEITAPLDHRLLNEVAPFDRINTTAELISRHVFEEIARRLPAERGLRVERVEVWEGPSSFAAYRPS
ncbi:MAG: 6-carboxytetrahydropterin synthase QueD [Thermoanaerobaculia bacterium]|nr:6-carboxytetrahydropterin synthase QueD [Thermoanaerobaculia bacterium]